MTGFTADFFAEGRRNQKCQAVIFKLRILRIAQ